MEPQCYYKYLHKDPKPIPTLSDINPVRASPSHLQNITINISLPSDARPSKMCLSLSLLSKILQAPLLQILRTQCIAQRCKCIKNNISDNKPDYVLLRITGVRRCVKIYNVLNADLCSRNKYNLRIVKRKKNTTFKHAEYSSAKPRRKNRKLSVLISHRTGLLRKYS